MERGDRVPRVVLVPARKARADEEKENPMRLTRTFALVGLGTATALFAGGLGASQASAAATPRPFAAPVTTATGGFVVHAGRLVLTETSGHYQGTLSITARNTAATPVSS